ncbi:hypothetical protein HMI54_009393 [Coelomomyces lativittatus]|nr:hypothetical protein HMI55_006449 [Coelomomyces lativittatus]KAJ1514242.1 hypothetical protein HMI56_000867 [Coelomomyces lativittatus]KAJ1516430.1 hypothetical protein HMI54_009393 [Coelomomyces lativittatus]
MKKQQFWVVQCSFCSIFQVQQVKKKLTQFKCKVCTESSEWRQCVYFVGNASACRVTSQKLSIEAAEGKKISPLSLNTLGEILPELKEIDIDTTCMVEPSSNPSTTTLPMLQPTLCRPSQLTSLFLQTGEVPPVPTNGLNNTVTLECIQANLKDPKDSLLSSSTISTNKRSVSTLSATTPPPSMSAPNLNQTTNELKFKTMAGVSQKRGYHELKLKEDSSSFIPPSSSLIVELSKKLKLDLSKVTNSPFQLTTSYHTHKPPNK